MAAAQTRNPSQGGLVEVRQLSLTVMDGSPAFQDSLMASECLEPVRFCPDTRTSPKTLAAKGAWRCTMALHRPGSGVGQGHLGNVA